MAGLSENLTTAFNVLSNYIKPLRFFTQHRFQTRAALVASVASGDQYDDGYVVTSGPVSYIAEAGATVIPDIPGFKPHLFNTPEHYGAAGDAPDPNAFFTAADPITAFQTAGASKTDDLTALTLCSLAQTELGMPMTLISHYYTSDVVPTPVGAEDFAVSRERGPFVQSFSGNPHDASIHTGGKAVFAPLGFAFLSDGGIDRTYTPNFQVANSQYEGFTVVGNMDPSSPCHGIIAANARGLIIENVPGFGFSNGSPYAVFGFRDGGTFKATIRDAYIGHDAYIKGGQTRTLQQVEYSANRWGVRVLTRAHDLGRVNDLVVENILGYTCTEGFLDMMPNDEGGTVSNYGPGNIVIKNCMSYSEVIRKFRELTVTPTGNSLVYDYVLHTDFDDDAANDNYNRVNNRQFVLVVWNTDENRFTYRTINTHDQSAGTITLYSALPANYTDARIIYTLEEINNDLAFGTFPYFVRIASNENVDVDHCNVEEYEVPFLVSPEVKRFTVVATRTKVTDGVWGRGLDGTPLKTPVTVVAGYDEITYNSVSTHNVTLGNTLLLHDQGIDYAGSAGTTFAVQFDSTGTPSDFVDSKGNYVEAGMCLIPTSVLDSRTGDKIVTFRYSSAVGSNYPYVVAGAKATGAQKRYYHGDFVPLVLSGLALVQVRDNVAVAPKTQLVASDDGTFALGTPADPYVDAVGVVLGKTDGSGDGSGVDLVQVHIK